MMLRLLTMCDCLKESSHPYIYNNLMLSQIALIILEFQKPHYVQRSNFTWQLNSCFYLSFVIPPVDFMV